VTLKTDPPAFSGAGGGGEDPGSVRHTDTSGDVLIRLDVRHQDLVQLRGPPSSVPCLDCLSNLGKAQSNPSQFWASFIENSQKKLITLCPQRLGHRSGEAVMPPDLDNSQSLPGGSPAGS